MNLWNQIDLPIPLLTDSKISKKKIGKFNMF